MTSRIVPDSSPTSSRDASHGPLARLGNLSAAQQRLAEFPVVPYLSMPEPPAPEKPAIKRQKITFSGSAMDDEDAAWYADDEVMADLAETSLAHNVALPFVSSSTTVRAAQQPSSSSNTRQLARFDSEEAVNDSIRDS